MPAKVFISYSHKDECYKESFIEHMAGLKRSGIITEWNDRKIVAGNDWKNEIDNNLKESDLIIFLISSSFLNSDYCVDVEVQEALKMHENNEAIIIPILVRTVDWGNTPLAKLQALPKDAKPITSWDDPDAAWVNVIEGIKKRINQLSLNKPTIDKCNEISFNEEFLQWLDDTEIVLTHRSTDKVKLSAIYTAPDLRFIAQETTEVMKDLISPENLIQNYDQIVISGEEQQGKTSILKYYYNICLKQSYFPLYLQAKRIKTSNSEEVLKKAIRSQYKNLSYESFISSENIIIMVDDIDHLGLNNKHKEKLIDSLRELASKCIFTVSYPFSLFIEDFPTLDNYEQLEILNLGHKKREAIIQKWVSLGIEETIQDHKLYNLSDDFKEKINSIIRKNILPPKPIFILMILQMFEAHYDLDIELSSHGHCYQYLIYQSFENIKINKTEYDKYLNVLTELAWWIFTQESPPNDAQMSNFFKKYCENFLSVDKTTTINNLLKCSILHEVKDYQVDFKYPYLYYFFVAKKISESYSDHRDIVDKLAYLFKNLHREDYANILIFVAHHTKENWFINQLNETLSGIFSTQAPATLSNKQLSFMNDFVKTIPELIIEQREIQKERDKFNTQLDEQELREQTDDLEDDESQNILANLNKTFKGIEIAGQIIRNRHASLKKNTLVSLADTGISSGLRFLNYFIDLSHIAKDEVIKLISSYLIEEPNLDNKKIETYAENAYLHLTYGVINATLRKISRAVGSKEAIEIYEQIGSEEQTPAHLLLRLSIELNFLKRLDINSINTYSEKLINNVVCYRILKEMVVEHIYMFPIEYKDRQKLSELLGIPMKSQRLIQQKQRRIG